MRGYGEHLFSSSDLSSYLEQLKGTLRSSIQNESEEYIIQVNQEQYIDHLSDNFYLDYLELRLGEAYADSSEENIPAEHFPSLFSVHSGKSYPRPVYYYHVPFDGDSKLFHKRPSTFSFSNPIMKINRNHLTYKYVQFENSVEGLNREIQSINRTLENMTENINNDLRKYNESLVQYTTSIFEKRKDDILQRREQEQSLIVPIRKNKDVSETFSVPNPQVKKKIRLKPEVKSQKFIPDPTLHEDVYLDILRIINDMGKEFERKPSVYANKGEEDLRDHFLMLLEPHFDGNAGGETFNKSGKTDILLKHEGNNLFIGECKFWGGEKSFLKTIDQLLGYLTWRDSKAAVIMFVRNQSFTNVIETAKESIKTHDNYIKYDKQHDETWINYIFHVNGDEDKKIHLALMLYHTV